MSPYEQPSVSVSRRRSGTSNGEPGAVVWLSGEHDLATRPQLRAAFDAAALDEEGDIAVDLSGITFMDATTIGVLIGARNRLRARSDSLYVRSPSPWARWLLELCGLAPLIAERSAALQSWVAVPATAGSSDAWDTSAPNGASSGDEALASARPPEPAGVAAQGRSPK